MNEYSEPRAMPYSGGNRYSGAYNNNMHSTQRSRQAQHAQQAQHTPPPRPSRSQYAGQHYRYGTIPPPPVQPAPPPPAAVQTGSPAPSDLNALLNGLDLDEEKIIIIFLIVILARNGADLPLLAALGYLLM